MLMTTIAMTISVQTMPMVDSFQKLCSYREPSSESANSAELYYLYETLSRKTYPENLKETTSPNGLR